MENARSRADRLYYRSMGDGPPIVLLHGYASSSKVNWQGTGWATLLSEHGRRVVMPDLRGHGNSPKSRDPDDYHPQRMAQDILAVMDEVDPGPWELMGYSMGSWVGGHLVGTYPERFACAVLGGIGDQMTSLGRNRESIAQAMLAPTIESIRDPVRREMRRFAQQLKNDLPSLAACIRGAYPPVHLPLERADLPILFVVAENDGVVGRPTNLSRQAPRSEVAVVAGEDHLTAMMSPNYKRRVLEFLQRCTLSV